jgi:hypothetical protein
MQDNYTTFSTGWQVPGWIGFLAAKTRVQGLWALPFGAKWIIVMPGLILTACMDS